MGISMQKDSDIPLDENFTSGKLVKKVTQELAEYTHHKTNLVNYAPLDENGKLRYPTKKEIRASFEQLQILIEQLRPKIIIALGGLVVSSLGEMFNIEINTPKGFEYQVMEGVFSIISVQHPSYISIYKRKHIDKYISGIVNSVRSIVIES